jgi:hypothetical protein
VPWALTGCTYDADGGNDLRNSTTTALLYPLGPASGSSVGSPQGVLGTGLGVTAASGMNVHVGGGSFAVSNPTAVNGGYIATLASQITLTVAASDPVNPRIDLVCATVTDNGNSTSSGEVQIITGTAAPSPSAPSTPPTSIRLALVTVPALSTSVVSGDINDVRSYTSANGGIANCPIANAPNGYNGAYFYDPGNDRLYHNAASGARQARVLPWAPVTGISASNVAVAFAAGRTYADSTPVTFVTVNCDGNTNLKITYSIPGVAQSAPGNAQVAVTVWLDGTSQLCETDLATYAADSANISQRGFTGSYTTSAAVGDTPSAGTHGVYLQAAVFSAVSTSLIAGSGRLITLRVEPETL